MRLVRGFNFQLSFAHTHVDSDYAIQATSNELEFCIGTIAQPQFIVVENVTSAKAGAALRALHGVQPHLASFMAARQL